MSTDQHEPKKQQRSLVTEQKVLEATDALINELGYEATHVSKIIKKSGVSAGSFYHHFGSKEAVMLRLTAAFFEAASARFNAVDCAGCGFEDVVDRYIDALIEEFRINHGTYRAMVENINVNRELWEPLRDVRRLIEARLLEHLGSDLQARGCKDPAHLIGIMMQTILGLLTHAIVIKTGPLDLNNSSDRHRVRQVAQAIMKLE